jgi:hypothetical protein
MAALVKLSDEEKALVAIITDQSGLDQAEFLWFEPDHEETYGCFRAWPFQHKWWRDESTQQIDQAARSVGKSLSMQVRTCAFPLLYPGQEMLLTAPEEKHLKAVTSKIVDRLKSIRFYRELLQGGPNLGIAQRPFQISFRNRAQIMGRIPKRDGSGVKGMHPIWLEMDEAQDYPSPGWTELFETLKTGKKGARWRCVAEGQHVLTERGWIPIESVVVGDRVWTHKNRWRPVLAAWDNGIQPCVLVKGEGHHGLELTPGHKVWLRSSGRKSDRKVLGEPEFRCIGSAASKRPYDHWASPVVDTAIEPIPGWEYVKGGRRLEFDTSDSTWLWLYGLYLAEGYGCDFESGGRRHRRVHWCVNDKECDTVADKLRSLGLKTHFYRKGRSVKVVVSNAALHDWLVANAGKLAHAKTLAPWVFGLDRADRLAIFDGMNFGDGCFSDERQRGEYFTASRSLAFSYKLLAQSLGFVANMRHSAPHLSVIEGREVQSRGGIVIQTSRRSAEGPSTSVFEGGHVWSNVRSVTDIGDRHVYDLTVEEDHSYVVEGIVVSNSHGVTRGVRDEFWRFTQPESGWQVNRITAMHRPTWTDEERKSAVGKYGSENHPDYRRNILGLHGDMTNPLFVLHRLMRCVDMDSESDYNTNEFYRLNISDEWIQDAGGDILTLIDPPLGHRRYKTVWIGMDVGLTNHPSEILVFAEEEVKGSDSKLKLLARYHLERVSAPDQTRLVLWLISFYNTRAFAMDKTGLGLPIFQELLEQAKTDPKIKSRLDQVKGYNFSQKLLVEFDESVNVEEFGGDEVEDRAIYRNALEYSSDKLRELVDDNRILLPDDDIVQEFQGQTWTIDKSGMNMYGKKTFSRGSFHALDAARMAACALFQYKMEKFLREHRKVDKQEPVYDVFVG